MQSEDLAGIIAGFPTLSPFPSKARSVLEAPLPSANARTLAQQAASGPGTLVRYSFEL